MSAFAAIFPCRAATLVDRRRSAGSVAELSRRSYAHSP